MITLQSVSDIEKAISVQKNAGKTIGFVPTMGALHQGHVSLVKECCAQNDVCVVSVFVNPTQFNNKEDLEKYPRDIEKDLAILKSAGAGIVFVPTVKDIYPEPDTRQFNFDKLDKVMEGKFRPGHFNGVAQVVSRLFNIVKPDKAYFGEKDFQQLAIIRNMVTQLKLPVEIIAMPIIREENGLAMSSRNQRLSETQKREAAVIYKTLSTSKQFTKTWTVTETIEWVINEIEKANGLRVEYFEIVDGNSLQTISSWTETTYAVGCIAVFCGEIRLIDNITYYNMPEDVL